MSENNPADEFMKEITTVRSKIFKFGGEKPSAINLDHVTQILVDGKRITFQFYSTAMYVDLEDEKAALATFDTVLNIWAESISKRWFFPSINYQ